MSDRTFSRGKAILWGGFLCGVLDIAAAFTQYALRGVRPARILQAIAAGLLGRSSFQGGAATAALGGVLHFVIAFGAAAVYYAASRRMAFLRERPLPAGVLFGAAVYFFMNYVVLPLSRFPAGPFNWQLFITGLLIHMIFVGPPISFAVWRFARQATTGSGAAASGVNRSMR